MKGRKAVLPPISINGNRLQRVLNRVLRKATNPAIKRSLFFIHIPKCAGSSFQYFVDVHLANWRTEIIRPKGYNDLERGSPDGFRVANVARSEDIRFRLFQSRENRVVMGHVCFYEYMKGLSDYSFATILRNPVDRLISHYYYFHEEDPEFHALLDWLNSPRTQLNLQTAFLCGNPKTEVSRMDLEMAKVNLHFFDFVGLVERFDLSLQLFCKIYQIRPSGKAHVVNVTRSESYLKREISQDVADLIAERSCYDIELYEYASGLFREKLRVLGLLESMTDLSHSRRIL